jgi:hypothetical protein
MGSIEDVNKELSAIKIVPLAVDKIPLKYSKTAAFTQSFPATKYVKKVPEAQAAF